jgi:hypothetical protein
MVEDNDIPPPLPPPPGYIPVTESTPAQLVGTEATRTKRRDSKLLVVLAIVSVVVLGAVAVGIVVGIQHGDSNGSSAAIQTVDTVPAPADTTPDTTPLTDPPTTIPWYPADFYASPAAPDFAYKFLTGSDIHCDVLSCWNIVVIPVRGCPGGISVQMQVLDAGGNVVGSATDTVTAPVNPKQTVLLKPYDFTSGGVKGGSLTFTCT